MRRLTLVLALVATALVVAGCAGDDDEIDLADPAPQPEESGEEELETVHGTLGGDPRLEGGCLWLDGDEGDRYDVRWPSGWEADTDAVEVRDDDGELVAREGDELTVRGTTLEDVATVCQVGTPFRAEQVEAD